MRTIVATPLLLLLCGALSASATADARAAALAEFGRCDRDGSGYLSRAEMQACGCESYDRNGDQILMPAEFLAGRGVTSDPGATSTPATGASAPGSVTSSTAGRPSGTSPAFRAGGRVEAGCYGNMKAGTIDRLEGSRAYVRFADEPNCDGWRDLASLRPAGAAAAQRHREGSASGGPPPSGVYVCQKISGTALVGLGNLQVRGRSYAGLGGGPFAPFEVDAGRGLVWTKGLRGLPEGWTILSSRYAGLDAQGRPLIKIAYQAARGWRDEIDCVRE